MGTISCVSEIISDKNGSEVKLLMIKNIRSPQYQANIKRKT